MESHVRLRNALQARDAYAFCGLSAMKFKALLSIITALIPWTVALPSVAQGIYGSPYGDPAQSSAATREILIDPNTKSVNVKRGEIVTFNVGERTFTWRFDGKPHDRLAFDLRDIAPPDTLDRPVTVYVAGDSNDKG
jgi:hypothetical protein